MSLKTTTVIMSMHETVDAHKIEDKTKTKSKGRATKPVLRWQDAQRIEALVANPEDLSLMPVFHMVEGCNEVSIHKCLCECVFVCMCNKS